MDPSQFSAEAPGKVIKNTEGYWAFVPDPLPSKLHLGEETWRLLSQADQKIGELSGLGKMLPNPHMLIGPFLKHEAVLSSRIEGTQATEEDLLLFDLNPAMEMQVPDVKEVANYVQALEYGIQRIKTLPMSLRLICELHGRLLKEVRGRERSPGQFRKVQNYIAPQGQPIQNARFVPPPVTHLSQVLDQFEKFLGEPSSYPILIDLALVHYQFESIHPFIDGNGRIGRLILSLLLCEREVLSKPMLYLSAYFEKHRQQYVDLMLKVSRSAAWEEWIQFFLQGIRVQSEDAITRSQKLLELWREHHRRMQTARASALTLDLVDSLFASPATSIPRAAARLNVTFRTAKQNIDRLVEKDILREVTGYRRNRMYIAPEILSILTMRE